LFALQGVVVWVAIEVDEERYQGVYMSLVPTSFDDVA
jgi:hypothetical protein